MRASTATTLSLLGTVGCDMEAVWVPIAVAVITGPLVVVLNKLRRENTDQHAEARILLGLVARKVDKVGEKLDKHIGWHEGQGDK